jgi:methylenetetrahydrofolate reductase (NADPH)
VDLVTDRRYLAAKLQLADFAVTQFFFEFDSYKRLVDDLADLGVEKPVLPGIMPVTSLSSIPRMAMMGAAVPGWAIERLEEAGRLGPDHVRQVGIDMATELCSRLLDAGAPGLHFYTLNRSNATREIYGSLGIAST